MIPVRNPVDAETISVEGGKYEGACPQCTMAEERERRLLDLVERQAAAPAKWIVGYLVILFALFMAFAYWAHTEIRIRQIQLKNIEEALAVEEALREKEKD